MEQVNTSIERHFGVYNRKLRSVTKSVTGCLSTNEITALKRSSASVLKSGTKDFGTFMRVWEHDRVSGETKYISSNDEGCDEEIEVVPEIGKVFIVSSMFCGVRTPPVLIVHPKEII